MRTTHQNLILPCLIASALLLGVHETCSAANQDDDIKNPLGCRDVGYKFDLNVLQILPRSEGDDQSLYFMYNKPITPSTYIRCVSRKAVKVFI